MSVIELLSNLSTQHVELWVEGSRLRYRGPRGVVTAEQRATLSSRRPEVVRVLREQAAATVRYAPLSYNQLSLWFIARDAPESAAYNIPISARIPSPLEPDAIREALQALTDRHAILRTTYQLGDDGHPVQRTVGSIDVSFEVHEVPEIPEPSLRCLVEQDYRRPFDLERGPVFRASLYRRAPDDHVLLLVVHHIAADALSLGILAEDLRVLLGAASGVEPPVAPRADREYADFVEWQSRMLAGPEGERLERYWESQLRAPRTEIELPSDNTRPPRKTYRGATVASRVGPELLTRLRVLGRECSATLYVLLLAAFDAMLFRLTGTEDVVVGTPTLGRTQDAFSRVVGHFVSPVPVRVRVRADTTFRALVGAVRTTVHEALEHQDYPLFLMVQRSQSSRDASRSPLFETFFSALHVEPFRAQQAARSTLPAGSPGEMVYAPYPIHQLEGQFDLTVQVVEGNKTLDVEFRYATDLFEAATVERMLAQYLMLLGEIVADPDRPVRDLPILTPEDEYAQLEQLNATSCDVDLSRCLHDVVTEVAAQNADKVAITAPDETLTYAVLERRANQLAHMLRAGGVGKGSVVGVCVDRTSFLPVALLGVLKTGASYVPLDPSYPQERLAYTLLDAHVRCVVTEQRFAALVEAAEVPLVLVDADRTLLEAQPGEFPAGQASPDDLAYIIYTSGSSGRPKGVEIEHRSLVNFLHAMRREPGIGPDDVLLAVTTPSFDIAGLELFFPLVAGAQVVIATRDEVTDGERLGRRMTASGATMMQATPATWRLLIDAGWEGSDRLTALCGGESLTRDLAVALSTRVRALWNMYGPTETTIWSTVHRVSRESPAVRIGHPIGNTTVFVLDASGRLCPVGTAGELCIGGAGVARGYRNRADLTAERFVMLSLPGRPAERVYRTGDVVRLRNDLTLEFIGRRDDQVKLRGYRIELGEIESVLSGHESVKQAVVALRSRRGDDPRIVAWVQLHEDQDSTGSELRRYLRQRLPEFMIPSMIATVDAFPLTPNGKIDRRMLPDAFSNGHATCKRGVPPSTSTEKIIADIWMRLLSVDRLAVTDSFFELGGHSLLAMQAANEITAVTGRVIDPRLLFFRTLGQLAEACDAQPSTTRISGA